jgi:hypothetical protein
MSLCRSSFSRYISHYNPITGKEIDINCHSWRCPKHRHLWSKKIGSVLARTCESFPENSMLLVNLTTATYTNHQEIEYALRLFMQSMRKAYGRIEYVKIVEYNRRQTQPHFHMIFRFDDIKIPSRPLNLPAKTPYPENVHIPISYFWRESLIKASIKINERDPIKETWVTWCQPPKDGNGHKAAKYAVGYISGGNGHKDYELPNDSWQGRRVTYSKHFFPTSIGKIWKDLLSEWFDGKPCEELVLIRKTDIDVPYENMREVMRLWSLEKVVQGEMVKAYVARKTIRLKTVDGQTKFILYLGDDLTKRYNTRNSA